jgi:hypothetical protein
MTHIKQNPNTARCWDFLFCRSLSLLKGEWKIKNPKSLQQQAGILFAGVGFISGST